MQAIKPKNRLNLLALNLTANLQTAQTRSRQIYKAAPTETSQGMAKFIILKFKLNLRANFTKRRGASRSGQICKPDTHASLLMRKIYPPRRRALSLAPF
nr:hypothetical protein [uncultured Campylobacter sp.]